MSSRDGSKAVFVLVFILCCHAVGLLVFCKGFLLKRVVIPEYTQCTSHSPQDLSSSSSSVSGHVGSRDHNSCSEYPKRFNRVVWLLIDALRYDFLDYGEHLDPVPVYRNKVPFVRDLLRDRPSNAMLFRFVADPPTTTMQRLKALSTGGLPTFIDISNNFNSYEILEDNLIHQAKKNARNVTFMGDDTWLGLYPHHFSKTFDYPSLNVKDLHTVDNGVMTHLVPELAKRDADFIIAHFLGVDHVGHTYGPSHWTMGDKLSQMNEMLRSVLNSVDNDTLVFVFGDHGMTSTGDHGGETELETNAALLVYSSRPIFNPHQPSGRPVYQIDIVPTVAMVLGLPIPFSSLGMIIPEVFLPYREQGEDPKTFEESFENGYSGRVTKDFLTALRINALQIEKYLTTYVRHSGDFPPDVFRSLQNSLNRALQLHQNSVEKELTSQKELSAVAAAYVGYMKNVKQMCQSVWAKFDDIAIFEGLTLLLLSVVVVPLMLADIQKGAAILKKALPYGAVCGPAVIVLALFVNIVHLDFSISGLVPLVLVFLLYCLSVTIVVWIMFSSSAIFRVIKDSIRGGVVHFVSSLSILQLLATVIALLYGVAMLSNSFVLYEGDMMAFFIQSLLVCFAMKSLQLEFKDNANIRLNKAAILLAVKTIAPHVATMACVRLVKVFYACRDLQIQDGCVATSFIHALPVAWEFLGWLAKWRMVLSCAAVSLVPALLLFLTHQSVGGRHLHGLLRYVGKFGFPTAVICVSGFWLLLCSPQSDLEALSPWQHVALPRLVYLISVVAAMLCVVRPLKASRRRVLTMNCEEVPCNNVSDDESTRKNDNVDEKGREELIDGGVQRPRQRRQKLAEEQQFNLIDSSRTSVMDSVFNSPLKSVIPLVTLHLLVSLWIPLALLLNDGIALSAVLMAAQVALTIRSLKETESGASWPVCVLWGLMSSHFFFGFGHHATVTSLRFEAGFVGLHGEMHSYNLPFAAALVGLNTLGSQLLFGLGLPLLLLLDAKPSLTTTSPSEKVFKIALLYITFHSVKMFVTVLAASVHRRHLMVWWVFAPRFMYEGAFQITTDICAILSYMFINRIEHQLSTSDYL